MVFMTSWRTPMLLIASIIVMGSMIPMASGEIQAETAIVDIDHYEEVEISFDSGESIRITVRTGATEYPISVFLLKGEEARSAWIESEEVDLEAIKSGVGVPDQNTTFQVVSPFSRRNVTSFDGSITLGEHDDYYVVIALYRDSTMSTEEVLNERATLVDYEVEWVISEKDVPWHWLIIAVAFFVIGAALLGIYFWRGAKEEPEYDEGPSRAHGVGDIRRSPPRGGYRSEDRISRAPPRPGHVEDRSNDNIRRAPQKPGYVRDGSNDNIRRAPPRYS